MKILAVIVSALGAGCLLFACKSTNKTTGSAPVSDSIISDISNRKLVQDKELYGATTEVLPIDTVYIESSTLHVVTQKLQACNSQNFQLVWNGALMKSMPPQAATKLLYVNDGTCKTMNRFHLTFNVSPLKIKQDSTGNKTTIVRVGGWKQPVKYDY